MSEIISMDENEVTFDVDDSKKFITVKLTVTEFDDGDLVLTCKYGDEKTMFRKTSIENETIVDEYNS